MSHDPTAPPPPTPSTKPRLTPQFCFNTTALRDFLRLSRATVDDSLSLHLNSLLEPSRRPFSVSQSPNPAPGARTRRQIPGQVCKHFKHAILFPSWADREETLTYCSEVAQVAEQSPNSSIDELQSTKPAMHMPSDKTAPPTAPGGSLGPSTSPTSADPYGTPIPGPEPAQRRPRTFWGQEQVPDERTDPYSARDYSYTRQGRVATLQATLESEKGVERIVRARTWSVLGERCLDDGGEGYAGGGADGYETEWRSWMEGRRK